MNRVVVMDLDRHNTVLAGHDRYFVFESDGRVQVVLDRCPHRGGPLSLARLTPDGRRLTCPWHGTKVGTAALRRTSVPMVRTGSEAVIVLPGVPAEVPVTTIRRRILANLPPVDPACGTGGTGGTGGIATDDRPAPASPQRSNTSTNGGEPPNTNSGEPPNTNSGEPPNTNSGEPLSRQEVTAGR